MILLPLLPPEDVDEEEEEGCSVEEDADDEEEEEEEEEESVEVDNESSTALPTTTESRIAERGAIPSGENSASNMRAKKISSYRAMSGFCATCNGMEITAARAFLHRLGVPVHCRFENNTSFPIRAVFW